MYVYLHMCTYKNKCICAYTYIYINTCIFAHICNRKGAGTANIHMRVAVAKYVDFMYMYLLAYICIHICVYIYIYIYIYIYMYVNCKYVYQLVYMECIYSFLGYWLLDFKMIV